MTGQADDTIAVTDETSRARANALPVTLAYRDAHQVSFALRYMREIEARISFDPEADGSTSGIVA